MSNNKDFTIDSLLEIIRKRKLESKDVSYTASLFDKGIKEITKKFGEESVELIIAVFEKKQLKKQKVISEAADLIYHFLVLIDFLKIDFSEILLELEKRRSSTGFEEKEGRNSQQDQKEIIAKEKIENNDNKKPKEKQKKLKTNSNSENGISMFEHFGLEDEINQNQKKDCEDNIKD